MFKLKLINKPKMIKLKCGFSFPNIVLANLQEKEVIPTKEVQEIVADKTYDGLSKVTVQSIPNEYIVPSGEIEFTQNGTYDVTDKASAKVNIKEKVLGTKTITSNGTYKAIDDNLDGYSEVEVATSGVDINEYLSDTITKGTSSLGGWAKTLLKMRTPLTISGSNGNYMFYNYPLDEIPQIDTSNLITMSNMFAYAKKIATIPLLNTSNVTDMSYMSRYCESLKEVPQIDTSHVENMTNMFANCKSITTIPQLDTSLTRIFDGAFEFCPELITIPQFDLKNVTSINSNTFYQCSKLQNVGGLKNIGYNFQTMRPENYQFYLVSFSWCQNLTEQSIINVLTNLYDIATKGVKPQRVILGATNLAKLTSTEGQAALAQAQQFGWNVS